MERKWYYFFNCLDKLIYKKQSFDNFDIIINQLFIYNINVKICWKKILSNALYRGGYENLVCLEWNQGIKNKYTSNQNNKKIT